MLTMLGRNLDCAICGSYPTSNQSGTSLFLCGLCHRELRSLKIPAEKNEYQFFKVLGAYLYKGIIKQLIRRAKIDNEIKASNTLSQLFLDSKVADWGHWADVMIPSPSSMWGRARGRTDLASILGKNLAKTCNRPFLYPPMRLYGRFHKKALMHHLNNSNQSGSTLNWCTQMWQNMWCSQDKKWAQSLEQIPSDPLKIALVDDVVTTGQTLQEIANALSGIINGTRKVIVCKLALAQSPNY